MTRPRAGCGGSGGRAAACAHHRSWPGAGGARRGGTGRGDVAVAPALAAPAPGEVGVLGVHEQPLVEGPDLVEVAAAEEHGGAAPAPDVLRARRTARVDLAVARGRGAPRSAPARSPTLLITAGPPRLGSAKRIFGTRPRGRRRRRAPRRGARASRARRRRRSSPGRRPIDVVRGRAARGSRPPANPRFAPSAPGRTSGWRSSQPSTEPSVEPLSTTTTSSSPSGSRWPGGPSTQRSMSSALFQHSTTARTRWTTGSIVGLTASGPASGAVSP